jgi:hypothetical protein
MLVQRERGKSYVYRIGVHREGGVLVECLYMYIEKVRVLLKSLFKEKKEGLYCLYKEKEEGVYRMLDQKRRVFTLRLNEVYRKLMVREEGGGYEKA